MSDTPEEQAAHERLARLQELHEKRMEALDRNIQLKAQVEELRKDLDYWDSIQKAGRHLEDLQAENARMAAEIQEMQSRLSPDEWNYLRRARLG